MDRENLKAGPRRFYNCQKLNKTIIYTYIKLSLNTADKIYLLKFATVCFTVKTALYKNRNRIYLNKIIAS